MLIALLVFSLVVGLYGLLHFKPPRRQETYLMADRQTTTFALTSTLVMTELNTATLIAFSSMGYLVGFRALWLPFVFLVGLNVYAFTVAKKWKSFNGLCVSDWFRQTYGKQLGAIASICLLSAMVGFSAVYVKSMALIFQGFVPGWPLWQISLVLTMACLMFSLRGGLPSIIWVDKISFIAVLILFPVLLWLTYQNVGTPNSHDWISFSLANPQELLPSRFIISIICITSFTYILAPWYGQKVLSAKNHNTAFKAVLLAAFVVFGIYGIGIMTTSLVAMHTTLSEPQLALTYAISHLPNFVSWMLYGVIFLIALTTLCGVWSAMATLMVSSLKDTPNDKTQIAMGLTVGCALTSFVLGNTLVDSVLDKLILANIPVFALAFSLYAGFYWQNANRYGAWASLIVGVAWGIATYLYFGEQGGYTWYWAIWGVPIIIGTGLIGNLFPKILNLYPKGRSQAAHQTASL